MITGYAERLLPYTAENLFDLVADVERYPEFLPWWLKARVRDRKNDTYLTEQKIALGPIRIRFDSKTMLQRPSRIEVSSYDEPFRRLKLSWIFEKRPGIHCRVKLVSEFEFRSHVLQKLAERFLPDITPDIVAAFETRAARMRHRRAAGMQPQ